MEACIIAWSLRKPLWAYTTSFKKMFNTYGRTLRKDHQEHGSPNFTSGRQDDLCNHATALLLLRGVNNKIDRTFLQKLLNLTNLPDEETKSGQDSGNQGSIQQAVTRRYTTELESGPLSPPDPTIKATTYRAGERMGFLYQAFGSNALAHKEKRIDLVTTASTALVLVKLLVIPQAPWFTAYALLTISGWIAVQLLLLLLHSREMREAEMLASVQTALALRSELDRGAKVWRRLFFVCHLPLFAFLSHFVVFRLVLPSPLQWLDEVYMILTDTLLSFLFSISMIGILGCMIALICLTIILLVKSLIRFRSGEVSRLKSANLAKLWIQCALAILLFSWVGLGSLTYVGKFPSGKDPEKYQSHKPLFDVRFVEFLVDGVFRKFSLELIVLIIFLFFTLIPWALFMVVEADLAYQRKKISVGNAAITLGVLLWYLLV